MKISRTALIAALAVVLGASAHAAPKTSAGASYTIEQAERGRLDYYESCAECHGGKLGGVFGPALAGPDDNLQYQTVTDVYAYMSAHMPHGNPESLPQATYLEIMAFLMQQHGLASGSHPLTTGSVAIDKRLMGTK